MGDDMIQQDLNWILFEEYHTHTRNTVVNAVVPITARLEALEQMRMRTSLPISQVANFRPRGLGARAASRAHATSVRGRSLLLWYCF